MTHSSLHGKKVIGSISKALSLKQIKFLWSTSIKYRIVNTIFPNRRQIDTEIVSHVCGELVKQNDEVG